MDSKPFFKWGGEDEELISAAYLGLCKAAIAYEPEKGTSFVTYASYVIRNEILMEIRRHSKRGSVGSFYDASLPKDEELCLTDAIPDRKSRFENKWACSMIRNSLYLDDREKRLIFQLVIQERRQKDVAKEMAVTQAQVSRLRKKALRKLKEDYLLNYA